MRPVSTNSSSNTFSPGGAAEVGLFGKLPSRGDFVRRRVADAFVDAWDAWLRECLAASREALGDRWLDIYLAENPPRRPWPWSSADAEFGFLTPRPWRRDEPRELGSSG